MQENSVKAELPSYNEKVLALSLDLAKSMVQSGAEINRVEETVRRVCLAYGIKKTEVFSVVSMVYATITDENGKTQTQMRRIYNHGPNFDRLEQLNAFSRRICNEKPDVDQAAKEFQSLFKKKSRFRPTVCLGYLFAAAGFTLFFGGTFLDAAASLPIAFVIYLMQAFIRATGVNRLFFTALTSMIAGLMALAFVRLGFGENADMIMIGDIMLVIPGLMLINSVREMLCGDIMSGLLRLLESIVISVAIACGFAVAIIALG
ncbi:MAG: threonine/serine exporter family protein [Acutalibacteraceae bacterium]